LIQFIFEALPSVRGYHAIRLDIFKLPLHRADPFLFNLEIDNIVREENQISI